MSAARHRGRLWPVLRAMKSRAPGICDLRSRAARTGVIRSFSPTRMRTSARASTRRAPLWSCLVRRRQYAVTCGPGRERSHMAQDATTPARSLVVSWSAQTTSRRRIWRGRPLPWPRGRLAVRQQVEASSTPEIRSPNRSGRAAASAVTTIPPMEWAGEYHPPVRRRGIDDPSQVIRQQPDSDGFVAQGRCTMAALVVTDEPDFVVRE